MKLHFFTFRKHCTQNEKEEPPVMLNCISCDDDAMNRSVVSLLDNSNKGFFVFRILGYGRSKNGDLKSSIRNATPTSSRTSSNPTTISSTKNNSDVTTGTSNREKDLPVSFVRIVPHEKEEDDDLLREITPLNLMKKYGLDQDDSIISYFKQVNDAYNEMMVVVENGPTDASTVYNVDNDDPLGLYNEQDAIDQSISMITMDPALTYKHSIILDEYIWQSFRTRYDSEWSDNDEERKSEPNDTKAVPIRYYEI